MNLKILRNNVVMSHQLKLKENNLGNNFAEEWVPTRGLRTDLQGQTFGLRFQIPRFWRKMCRPVNQSGDHESERILRQSCSLGCFLQAWAGVISLNCFSKLAGSIEVKTRLFHSNSHTNFKSIALSEFSTKWAQIWDVSPFWHTLPGNPY